MATPQWAEATVIEEVLRTLVVHPLGGNLVIIAAQVIAFNRTLPAWPRSLPTARPPITFSVCKTLIDR